MRIFTILLLCCVSLFGGQSLQTNGTNVTFDPPNTAPYTALGTFEVCFHLTDVARTASQHTFFHWGSFDIYFRVDTPNAVQFYDWYDGGSATLVIPETAFRACVQRDPSVNKIRIVSWDADGTNRRYAESSPSGWNTTAPNLSGSGYIAGANATERVAFVKIRSTLSDLASPPTQHESADLADWRLEGNLTDTAGSTGSLVWAGATYQTTPTYNPYPCITDTGAVPLIVGGAAGSVFSCSKAMNDTATLTYAWTQTAGPNTATLTGTTTSTLGISGQVSTVLAASDYAFQLVVEDDGARSTTTSVHVGAVPISNGAVVISNAAHQEIIGRVVPFGSSPWPWKDQILRKLVDDRVSTVPAALPQATLQSGTVAVSCSGTCTVTGTGTQLQTEFGCPSSGYATYRIIFHYTLGGEPGARAIGLKDCTSQTTGTLDGTFSGVDSMTGLSISRTQNPNADYWHGGSDNGDYYDVKRAVYNLHYRTGLTSYLTHARLRADYWYENPWYDRGRNPAAMNIKETGVSGLILRAEDGKPEYWTGITRGVQAMAFGGGTLGCGTLSTPLTTAPNEQRVNGYSLYFGALIARYHPDAPTRAQYLAAVEECSKRFTDHQYVDGSWRHRYWYPSYYGSISPGQTTITTSGVTPNVGFAMAFINAEDWYTVQAGSTSTAVIISPTYAGPERSNIEFQIADSSGSGGIGNCSQMNFYSFALQGLINVYEASSNSTRKTAIQSSMVQAALAMVRYGWDSDFVDSSKGWYYDNYCLNLPRDSAIGAAYRDGARYLSTEAIGSLARVIPYASGADQTELLAATRAITGASYGKLGGPDSDAYYASELDASLKLGKDPGYQFGLGADDSVDVLFLEGGGDTPVSVSISVSGRVSLSGRVEQ